MEADISLTGPNITVTIPYQSPTGTTATFRGDVNQVRASLVAFFGLERENVVGVTLSDLVVNATTTARAVGAIAGTLGGIVIASGPETSATPRQAAERDPWTQAQQPHPATEPAAGLTTPPVTAEPQQHPLIALIEQAADVKTLQRLWAENQAAFADPSVTAAWKARGRALT
ncbi:hypothetical protein [Actinoplanes sp. NPDC049118]|uniref:hypothetical protein n=1 Tax=Actinoplanes sp. NPDC049118 TaxID=3155769 RepID=UPI0033F2B328